MSESIQPTGETYQTHNTDISECNVYCQEALKVMQRLHLKEGEEAGEVRLHEREIALASKFTTEEQFAFFNDTDIFESAVHLNYTDISECNIYCQGALKVREKQHLKEGGKAHESRLSEVEIELALEYTTKEQLAFFNDTDLFELAAHLNSTHIEIMKRSSMHPRHIPTLPNCDIFLKALKAGMPENTISESGLIQPCALAVKNACQIEAYKHLKDCNQSLQIDNEEKLYELASNNDFFYTRLIVYTSITLIAVFTVSATAWMTAYIMKPPAEIYSIASSGVASSPSRSLSLPSSASSSPHKNSMPFTPPTSPRASAQVSIFGLPPTASQLLLDSS